MGWIQPCSPIQVDNSTAVGYVNNTIIARRLKSLKMRLNWLKCRESQDQFRIFLDKGSHNLADYHTKHHPPEYHIAHQHSHAGWIMQLHPTQTNLRVFPIPLPSFIISNLSCLSTDMTARVWCIGIHGLALAVRTTQFLAPFSGHLTLDVDRAMTLIN